MDFELFLKDLTPTLKAIAFKLNRGFSSMDEQDLFQEAVVFLWQGFNEGAFRDKTRSYILQGCYFHLQNHIRSSKDRFSRLCLDDNDGESGRLLEEKISLSDSSHEDFLEQLDTRLLADVICNNGLTDREKELLPLFAQGLTTRQIGARVGLSHVRVVKMKKAIGDKCRKYLDLKVQ
jgi:RNA polymerase sigma factor (sigma-70 family)